MQALFFILKGINLFLYFLVLFLFLVLPEYPTLNISLFVFALCLTIALILRQKDEFEEFVYSKRFKNMILHGTNVLLIFCIVAVINYLGFKNPIQLDFTDTKQNTLSSQSQKIVGLFEDPVKFKIFARNEDAMRLVPLLELFRLENSNLSYEIIDPELKRQIAEKNNISKYGEVVIEYQGKIIRFLDYSEKTIVNSLAKISRNKPLDIYFLSDHRTLSISDNSDKGLSRLAVFLSNEGIEAKAISINELSKKLPKQTTLAIMGPQDGFLKQEIQILRKFLNEGGSLYVALDPQLQGDIFGNLRELLVETRGITISNDFVVDSMLSVKDSGGSIPVIQNFAKNHPITEMMEGEVFFPLTSSVKVLDQTKAVRLAQTSQFPASWAETSFTQVNSTKVSFDKGSDLKGPITVMAANLDNKKRTVVVGNSTYLQNRYFNFQNNFKLFSNSINWLLDQGDYITFDRAKMSNEKLVISSVGLAVIFYFSIIFLPLCLFIIAYLMYRRRMIA